MSSLEWCRDKETRDIAILTEYKKHSREYSREYRVQSTLYPIRRHLIFNIVPAHSEPVAQLSHLGKVDCAETENFLICIPPHLPADRVTFYTLLRGNFCSLTFKTTFLFHNFETLL